MIHRSEHERARRLRARGWLLGSPEQPSAVGREPRRLVDAGGSLPFLLAQLPEDADLVIVPHSNAGLYVPALAEQRPVGGGGSYRMRTASPKDRGGSAVRQAQPGDEPGDRVRDAP